MKRILLAGILILSLAVCGAGCAAQAEPDAPPASSGAGEETPHGGAEENPIDGAFAHMREVLGEEEAESETMAYLYARQWYWELEEVFSRIDPNLYLYIDFDRDYILTQARMKLMATGEGESAANQFAAIGDFLRGEALRFHALLGETGVDCPYTVDEASLTEALSGYRYSLNAPGEWPGDGAMSAWSEEYPLLLLAGVPEKEVYLYHAYPFGMLLNIRGTSKLYPDWPGLSPRMGLPEMRVMDADSDGGEEIVITHTWVTGVGLTYISAGSLYVVEYNPDSGVVRGTTVFDPDDFDDLLKDELSLRCDPGARSLSLSYRDQTVMQPLPELPELNETVRYGLIMGELMRYEFQDDGRIVLRADLVAYCKDYPYPASAVTFPLTADVVYTDGEYSGRIGLQNVSILESGW